MRPTRPTRSGSVLPILMICLVGLMSFVALAVDLGMVAVSKTQCQNAADIAALVGCRNLDNKQPDNAAYDNNRTAALASARAAVAASPLMQGLVPTTGTNPAVKAGVYAYNTATQKFEVSYPTSPGAGRSWTALEVTLTANQPTYFMKLWGVQGMPTGARAVAVHRPRDIAFALDMTGSMAFSSTFNINSQSLNPDPLAPNFGHYALVQNRIIATANQTNASGEAISRNNYTITTPGGPPIVRNFVYVDDAANRADPSVAAFPLPADRSVVRNAFHRWSPPETEGNPTNYVSQTYNFAGYDAFAGPGGNGPTPAPDTFKTMTDGGGITYVGDRWRRADGTINKTNTSWSTGSASTKAAGTAVELLGYNVSGTSIRTGTSGGTVITTEDKFRDPVWERDGYDLDIPLYRAAKTLAGGQPLSPDLYPPVLVPAADRYQGFSMGPGYWGKTFFIWPPDPRAPAGSPGEAGYQPGDWRQRYFNRMGAVATAVRTSGGTTVTNVPGAAVDPQADNNPYTTGAGGVEGVNEVLFGSGQTLGSGTATQSVSTTDMRNNPPTVSNVNQTVQTFQVNYPAVLRWIKSGPQTLPPNLRAGRVLYYSSIPSDVNTATGDAQQQLDKLFWKNYIDFVLGIGSYTSSAFLYGAGDSWSGASRTLTANDLNTWTGPLGLWPGVKPYMRYNDSPNRPRLHFWFGPLSMMDFLGCQTNWNPGTCNEAQCWQLKAGMNSVLDDIRNNHPNDSVGMTMFAYSGYKSIRVAQGQDFIALKNALFYPKSLLTPIRNGDLTSEVRPYTSSWGSVAQDEIPNSNGATDPNTGLMLAFNLLSPSASLPANPYGTVKGRRGASKIVIFETDGVPNSYSNFTLNLRGYDTFYSNLSNGGSPGNGDATSMARAVAVAQQIVKPMATGNTSGTDSGLSLPSAKAKVYPIGFGDLFDASLAPDATFRPTALQFLADVGVAGGTVSAGATSPPVNQIITGSYANRISTLRTCLQQIFQSGVSVTLIE